MFNLYGILTFKIWKKILKIFFLAVTRLNLEKKHILAIFCIVMSSSLQLQFKKKISTIFFVILQSMTAPNFMSKAFCYQDLRRSGGGHSPSPLCIPLRGDAVCILFIFSEWVGIFWLNFAALIQVSIETFWDPYI